MAFFDEISKKVTAAGSKALQKTKDLTDCSSIKMNIANEEKKLKILYTELGEKYYEGHTTDHDSEYDRLFHIIGEEKALIAKFEGEMQEILNVRRCEICGAEIPEGFDFCTTCGNRVQGASGEAEKDPNRRYCDSCGAVLKEGMRFCTSCGARITQTEEEAPSVEEKEEIVYENSREEEPDRTGE